MPWPHRCCIIDLKNRKVCRGAYLTDRLAWSHKCAVQVGYICTVVCACASRSDHRAQDVGCVQGWAGRRVRAGRGLVRQSAVQSVMLLVVSWEVAYICASSLNNYKTDSLWTDKRCLENLLWISIKNKRNSFCDMWMHGDSMVFFVFNLKIYMLFLIVF